MCVRYRPHLRNVRAGLLCALHELQSKIARRALFVWAAVVPRAPVIIKALSRWVQGITR